jgi:hypothetical protein
MQITLFQLHQIMLLIEAIQYETMAARLAIDLINFYQKKQEDRDFYLKKLNEILVENVEKDSNGEMIVEDKNPVFNEISLEKYNSQLQEISQTLVDVPDLKIRREDLEGLRLSISQVALLKEED